MYGTPRPDLADDVAVEEYGGVLKYRAAIAVDQGGSDQRFHSVPPWLMTCNTLMLVAQC